MDGAERPEQRSSRTATTARAQRARARRNPRRGLILIVLGPSLYVLSGAAYLVGYYRWGFPESVGLIGQIPVLAAIAMVARGRRLRIADGEQRLAEDPRPPVLYLRPFDVDGVEIVNRMTSWTRVSPWRAYLPSYEERLARTLRRVGPLVAIGDPTETLPRLGAARLYAPDEEWQQGVDQLLDRACVVIVHTGERAGLAWELARVVDRGRPERVIVSLPLAGRRRSPDRQARYDSFLQHLAHRFPRPLPDAIGHSSFLYFDLDWTPHLLGRRFRPPPGMADQTARALRALAREFRILWGPRWLRLLVYFALADAAAWAVETAFGWPSG